MTATTRAIDLGLTTITPTEMTVAVESSFGIKAWLGRWTHQSNDFQDGRDFIAQERDLVTSTDSEGRKTKSGTISWQISADGLYEFGNAPTADGRLTRGFLRVEGDSITRLPYSKKSDLIAALPSRPRHGRRSADRDF